MKKNQLKSNEYRDLLRAYIDGDLSTNQRLYVNRMIQESSEWRQEYDRLDSVIQALQNVTPPSPPEHVWQTIEQAIETTQQKKPWFTWRFAHPRLTQAFQCASVMMILAISSYITFYPTDWSEFETYDVVVVQDSNGFAKEADTYIAYHDQTGHSTTNLIAYYSDTSPE